MSFPSTDIWNLDRTFTLEEFLNSAIMADHELLGSGKILASEFVGALPSGGALTDAASIEVPNNKICTLATAQSALTLNVTPDAGTVPNFAVEITPSAACTVTVTSTVGGTAAPLKYSAAAGNELASGKVYQLTCVGSCWTVAEFTAPTP